MQWLHYTDDVGRDVLLNLEQVVGVSERSTRRDGRKELTYQDVTGESWDVICSNVVSIIREPDDLAFLLADIDFGDDDD